MVLRVILLMRFFQNLQLRKCLRSTASPLCYKPPLPPYRTQFTTDITSKTETSKVGAISKAQKSAVFLKFVEGGTLSTF